MLPGASGSGRSAGRQRSSRSAPRARGVRRREGARSPRGRAGGGECDTQDRRAAGQGRHRGGLLRERGVQGGGRALPRRGAEVVLASGPGGGATEGRGGFAAASMVAVVARQPRLAFFTRVLRRGREVRHSSSRSLLDTALATPRQYPPAAMGT